MIYKYVAPACVRSFAVVRSVDLLLYSDGSVRGENVLTGSTVGVLRFPSTYQAVSWWSRLSPDPVFAAEFALRGVISASFDD